MNEEWDESIDEIGKKKKEKFYSSTKRKIRKYIPKEKELSHITILDDKKKQESKIDTNGIKKQKIYVSGIRTEYYRLSNKLWRDKEELRLLKRELPSIDRHLELMPKEIERYKQALEEGNYLLKKELEFPGFLKQKREEFLKKVRRKMDEDNINEDEREEIEKKLFPYLDLEGLKKKIKNVEMGIEQDFEMLEDIRNHKAINLLKIEELEENIQKLEPIVRILRDKMDNESKKLKAERSTNLMKLFDKEES